MAVVSCSDNPTSPSSPHFCSYTSNYPLDSSISKDESNTSSIHSPIPPRPSSQFSKQRDAYECHSSLNCVSCHKEAHSQTEVFIMPKGQTRADKNSQLRGTWSTNGALSVPEEPSPNLVQRSRSGRSHNLVSNTNLDKICNPETLDQSGFNFTHKQDKTSSSWSLGSRNVDKFSVNRCETSELDETTTTYLNEPVCSREKYSKHSDYFSTLDHSFSSSKSCLSPILSSLSSTSSSSSSFLSSFIHLITKDNPIKSFLMDFFPFERSQLPPLQGKTLSDPTRSTCAHSYTRIRGPQFGMTALLLVLHLLTQTVPSTAQVVGENMRCHQEGHAVTPPKEVLKDNPCLECVCDKGIVVCNKMKCPSMDGCYWKLFNSLGQCCQECKGCEHAGKMYRHGSSWSDGCSHYECLSGVLTVSQTQCHVPCYATLPLADNQCCQKCLSCWLEGRHVPEGEVVASKADPCIQCVCSSGHLTCEKKACPVLSCPPLKQIPVPGTCCKACHGSRDLISPPGGRCFLNGHLYRSGGERTIDPCTFCTCNNGYISCKRRTCPVLDCSKEFQMILENECCPSCSAAAELENVCRVPGMVHKHGDQWQVDKCTSCKCSDGETTCHMITCEYGNKPCPPGFRRVESESECCPRCEEAPGVCVVFGDPHYHTFDGMLFNFQGACKYTLAKTCNNRSFNLKVNNDARHSALFSWTKSLSLTVPGAKVKLGQKLRTKVNGHRVKSPYYEYGVLNITREGLAMMISTSQGIKILWDGASYVEVQVPVEMKGQVCGLCGNFNGNVTDDLATSDGTIMDSSDQMALSWATGRARTCSKMMLVREKQRANMKSKDALERLQRQNCPVTSSGLIQCGLLNSTVFQPCHSASPIDQFYNSCILDMCECKSSRRCECDTIQAYARQCERLGIPIPGWRQLSKCGGMECPHGAEYMECAPPCRPSCRNPTPNPECYTRRCRAGCFCPPPTVLHRGTCIPAQECPRRNKKRHRNR